MKKLCIVASYGPSIINFRKELVIALKAYYKVHVIIPFSDENVVIGIEGLGVVVHQLALKSGSMNFIDDFLYYKQMKRLFKQIQPDAVLSYTIKPVIWASLAAKKTGVKQIYSIITGLGYAFTELTTIKRKSIHKVVCILYKNALMTNTTVFFQNPDDASLFQQKKLIGASRVKVTNGSGVNLVHYQDLNSPPNTVTFLMIARLLKDKGIIEYLQAAEKIKMCYGKAVVFKLAGWFDSNPSCVSESVIQHYVDRGIIDFLGKLDDVRPAIASCSVYVLPSYSEGTPRTVLEAMSMGRSIITTEARGCRETVRPGYNGLLVPVKSVKSLVDAMAYFIQNPHYIADMGKNSRSYACEKYDVHAVNRVILASMEPSL